MLHAILDRQVDGLESVLDNIESAHREARGRGVRAPAQRSHRVPAVGQAQHPRAAPLDGQAARGAAAARPPRVRADLGGGRAAVPRRARPPGADQRSARRVSRHVDLDPGGVPVRGLEPDQRHHAVPDPVLDDHDAADRAHRRLRHELRAHAGAAFALRLSAGAAGDARHCRIDAALLPAPRLAGTPARASTRTRATRCPRSRPKPRPAHERAAQGGGGRDRIADHHRRFGHARRTAGRVDAHRRADRSSSARSSSWPRRPTRASSSPATARSRCPRALPANVEVQTVERMPRRRRRRSPPESGRRWSAATSSASARADRRHARHRRGRPPRRRGRGVRGAVPSRPRLRRPPAQQADLGAPHAPRAGRPRPSRPTRSRWSRRRSACSAAR